MLRLRLRLIEHTDFRRSDMHNTKVAVTRYKLNNGDGLARDEVICMVSHSENQCSFAFQPVRIEGRRQGRDLTLYKTVRLRIDGGKFDPLMIQNYANEVDLELVGIKRLEEFMKELRK